MSITFCRDDPVSARWTGVDRLLTEYEVDYNFYQHETRLDALEAEITTTVSIASVTQPSIGKLQVTLTDSNVQGPFDLPVPVYRSRKAWAPDTPYLANDTVTANGAYYRVLVDHTSAATFDPAANDGAGHDYYDEMIPSIGNSLPAGGATAQVLQKSSGTDYVVSWGYKLPTGGTQYQMLMKQSASNQDADWTTPNALHIDFAPATGSVLTATNVADALEEAALAGGGGGGALSSLSDVAIPTGSPSTGELLYFNGTSWTVTDPPVLGDLMVWDSGSSTWVRLHGTFDGDIIRWNGSTQTWEAADTLSTNILRNTTQTNLSPTSGTATLDPDLGDIFEVTPTGDMTINAGSGNAGAEITLFIYTSGTTSRTITFGTHFKTQGTLSTGTVSGKVFAVKFTGDSINLNEVSRTTAM